MAATADIPALVQRLRGGGGGLWQQQAASELAASELAALLAPWPRSDQQAAFRAAGGIPAAVHLVCRGTPAARWHAARLLVLAVRFNDAAFQELVAAGGLDAFVASGIASGDEELQESAVAALNSVDDRSHAARAVVAAGVVPLVAGPLRCRSPGSTLPILAASLLTKLGRCSHSISQVIAASGAVEPLVQLAERIEDSVAAVAGLTCMASLAGVSDHFSTAAAAAGAIPAAVQALASSADAGVQQEAAHLLGTMLRRCPHLGPAVVEAGGTAVLEQAWLTGSEGARQRIVATLTLLRQADQQQRECSRSGSIVPQPVASASPAPSTSAQLGQLTRPPRVCGAPGCAATHGLKRCGGCGAVRYCSVECSRVHWREHKAECRRLQAERAAAGSAGH